MTNNPFIKQSPSMENPFTTTRLCPTCDGELGAERYALAYLGEPIVFCTRGCMNTWGQDNIPNWQDM